MKVKELIEILQEYDPEMEAHTSYSYGDYWHTQVAPKVQYLEEREIVWSEYHRMPKVVEFGDSDMDDGDPDKETLQRVLLIG